ncbi:MAG: hypothetical protein Q9207_004537 [Kuettlingeria erythrocarpa]
MAKELVLCYCKKCNRHACTTLNSWAQLEAGFCTSEHPKLFANPGLIVSGQRKPASGELRDCLLQSLVCAGCEASIGRICVETSKDKKHYWDRIFLFLDMVTMKSMADGQPVEACIKAKIVASSKDSHAHPVPSKSKPATPGATNGNSVIAHKAQKDGPSNPQAPLLDDTKALLEGQRRDIDRIMTTVQNLSQDMKTMKATMEYLKFQQKTFATYNDHEAEGSPSAVTEDLRNLTEHVSRVTAKADKIDALTNRVESLAGDVSQVETKAKDTDDLREEVRDLSKACLRLDTRVNEVDRLKLEIKLMRRRVKLLEDANDRRATLDMPSKWGPASHSSPQRRSEPISDDNIISPEVPSSTLVRSQTAPVPARFRGSDSVPPQENGYDYMSDVSHVQAQHDTLYSHDKEKTPDANLVDILRPQITSAEKVAALKRRLAEDSSSSSSSPNAPPRRKIGRPRIHPRPDWTTKPSFNGGIKKKWTSLNDREHVLTSDPEDSDFDPHRVPDDSIIHQAKEGAKAISKAPFRIPTPEWEKPDWEGPSTSFSTSNTRGKSTARRGVSGRASISDRDAVRRRSSGYGYGDYVSALSPEYWDDESPAPSATPDLFAKPRDAQGRLLRPNGKVDGRSLRHQREREARAKLALQLQKGSEEGQQPRALAPPSAPGLVTGLSAPASGAQHGDAAALVAAGYTNLAAGQDPNHAAPSTMDVTTLKSSAGDPVKQETDTSGPPGSAPAALAMGALPQAPEDKHARLMNQVFPWR